MNYTYIKIIYQIVDYNFDTYTLLYRILKYEVKRQKVVFDELKTEIHQDLESIIGAYDSKILQFVKKDLIDRWKEIIEDYPEELKKIDMQIILNAFKRQEGKEEDDRDDEILSYLYGEADEIFEMFYFDIGILK